MANIPAEKTSSGAAWLPWLLGLLVLIGLIFVAFELLDSEPDGDEVAVVEDVDVASGASDLPATNVDVGLDTLASIGAIGQAIAAVRDGATDGDGVAVNLDAVEVQALTGDSTFAIGTGEDRILVVLASLGESEDGPGDGSDGVFNVDEGETISVSGSLKRYTPGMRGTADLSPEDVTDATRRQYVIVADAPSEFTIAD